MSRRQRRVGRISGQGGRGLLLWLVLILGHTIDLDVIAVATGHEEQERDQDPEPPKGLREQPHERGREFFNRITFHDTKLDYELIKIQVYSGRIARGFMVGRGPVNAAQQKHRSSAA